MIILILLECTLITSFYWAAILELLDPSDGVINFWHIEFAVYMLLIGSILLMGVYLKLSSVVCR